MFTQTQIDEITKRIVEQNIVKAVGISIDKIADEIMRQQGKRPSKRMVWNALQHMGAVAQGRKFIIEDK